MVFWIEIAKFLAGVIAWDIFVHANLLLSKIEPKLLGIHWTSRMNKSVVVVNLIALAFLIYIGWFSGFNI